MGATSEIHGRYHSATEVLPKWYLSATWATRVPQALHRRYMGDTKVLHRCHRGATLVIHRGAIGADEVLSLIHI